VTTQTEPGYLVTLSDGRQVFVPQGTPSVVGFGSAELYAVGYEHGQGRNVTSVSIEWVEAGQ